MRTQLVTSGVSRAQAVRRGRVLEYLTIGWNILEGLVAVGSGIIAGSAALVGFGVDSFIESLSGTALLWRLHGDENGEQRERLALKLVGISFLILAAYVAYEAITKLLFRESPDASVIGIGIAILSLIVMPVLARAKRRVAAQLDSRAMVADSRQTDLCAYLSAILLVGLAVNALFGWWWADPIAAIVMAPIIGKEGVEALRGETCDDCHG